MLQDLTAVKWLHSEAQFLHVCNGLPIQSPAAQPFISFPQLVFLQRSECRHMLSGQRDNLTLPRSWLRKVPENWSSLTCSHAK